jgi:hypothetical protein
VLIDAEINRSDEQNQACQSKCCTQDMRKFPPVAQPRPVNVAGTAVATERIEGKESRSDFFQLEVFKAKNCFTGCVNSQ